MNKLYQFINKPIFAREKVIFSVWMAFGVIYAIVKLTMGKYNNYKIFRHVYLHASDGLPLYTEYPDQYYDINHYGPLFSIVIAPFSLMPEWLGMILWILANTAFLFYAIRCLPFTYNQKVLIYWYALCELMTAQEVQQSNIAIAAIILLTFACIEKKRDFWAAFLIVSGTLIKIYPIVGLAFFFFSKHKTKFILSCALWTIILLFLPVICTPGIDYLTDQYAFWIERLSAKNVDNLFALSQNVSLLGVVRKVSGNASYSDLYLIIPGLILFLIPYFRFAQYKFLRFRFMLLANVLLFVVLFSTGSEASGYILAMIGVAIWYICSPSVHVRYNYRLFIITLIIVGISTTEIIPPSIRKEFIVRYALKAWPCIIVWLTICYEMIRLDFSKELENPLRIK